MTTGPDSPTPPPSDSPTPPPYAQTPGPPPGTQPGPPGYVPPPQGYAPPPQAYGGQPGVPPTGYSYPAQRPMRPDEEKMWAIAAHLGPLVLGLIAPLVIWLVFKDRNGKDRIVIGVDESNNPEVKVLDENGKEVGRLPAK